MNIQRILTLGSLLAAGFALSNCAPDSKSDAIANSEFYVTNTVTGDPIHQSVSCESVLSVGGAGGTNIVLTSQDSVSCGTNEVYQGASKRSDGDYGYSGLKYQVGQTYSVKLERDGSSECDKSGIFIGTVVLPEPVNLTAPLDGATVAKSAGFNVSWVQGTGATIELSLLGNDVGWTTTDTGSYSIPASQLKNMPLGASTLTLSRINNGQHPSGIKGGSTRAYQTQSISVDVVN